MSKGISTVVVTFFSILLLLGLPQHKVKAANLKIKYLSELPSNVKLDDKYYRQDKYLIYKYILFQFDQTISVSGVKIKFIVDKNWYNKNKIKDVIFLHYQDGHWQRVNYQSKGKDGDYFVYQILSSQVEGYWVIVGVLPDSKTSGPELNLTFRINSGNFGKKVELPDYVEKIAGLKQKIDLTITDPARVKGVSAIANATASASLLMLLISLNGLSNLFLALGQMFASLLGLLSKSRNYKKGMIYDIETGEPISLARVDLINSETGRVQATKFTDKNGMYYFLVPPGKFHLKVYKKGYKIVKLDEVSFLKNILKKEDLNLDIELNKPGIVKKNIAILKEQASISGFGLVNVLVRGKVWQIVFNILFYIGFAFSLWSVYASPKIFNFIVFGFYLIILFFKLIFLGKAKFGRIVDENGRPEPFAIVKILEPQSGKIITRAVTNTKGNYYIVLDPGEYILEIETNKGLNFRKRIKVYDAGVLTKKIIIRHPKLQAEPAK